MLRTQREGVAGVIAREVMVHFLAKNRCAKIATVQLVNSYLAFQNRYFLERLLSLVPHEAFFFCDFNLSDNLSTV
jgi:hypothetical protein